MEVEGGGGGGARGTVYRIGVWGATDGVGGFSRHHSHGDDSRLVVAGFALGEAGLGPGHGPAAAGAPPAAGPGGQGVVQVSVWLCWLWMRWQEGKGGHHVLNEGRAC